MTDWIPDTHRLYAIEMNGQEQLAADIREAFEDGKYRLDFEHGYRRFGETVYSVTYDESDIALAMAEKNLPDWEDGLDSVVNDIIETHETYLIQHLNWN